MFRNKFILRNVVATAICLAGVAMFSSCDKENSNDSSGSLKVGQKYQGGIVFYIDDTGKHGLIAAPKDEMGLYTWEEAIDICDKKVLDGYDDWYLPSKGELHELYLNRYAISGFSNEIYWSSSGSWHYDAWYQNFNNGRQDNYNPSIYNYATYRVRSIRSF